MNNVRRWGNEIKKDRKARRKRESEKKYIENRQKFKKREINCHK